MGWEHNPAGTVTQWAIEYTYDDGETRYYSDNYTEAEARREAEVVNLKRLYADDGGGSYPVWARAVSRTVMFGEWT